MHTPSSPWSIRLSLCFYRWLLRLGPSEYRLEYTEPTLQLFRDCCRDAYAQSSFWGVIALWPPMFSDVVIGMLAEQFSSERMRKTLPKMRWSIIGVFSTSVFFGIAYIFLMHIIDPFAPFAAIAQQHIDLRISYTLINWCSGLAFLTVVLGGISMLYLILKQTWTERGSILTLFSMPLKRVAFLLGLTVLLEFGFFAFLIALQFFSSGLLPENISAITTPSILAQLGIIALFTFFLLYGGTVIAQVILRGNIPGQVLRYTLLLMGITTLAMGSTIIAILLWITRLWIDAPQFANSMGLGPAGLRGNIGGSEGVVIVILMMLLAVVGASISLGRGLPTRTNRPTNRPSSLQEN